MQSFYFDLLKTWGDGLIRHQVNIMGEDFDGAFLCPACKYERARYVLPIIPDTLRPVITDHVQEERIFFLTGGFEATEYTVTPDTDGRFAIRLAYPER